MQMVVAHAKASREEVTTPACRGRSLIKPCCWCVDLAVIDSSLICVRRRTHLASAALVFNTSHTHERVCASQTWIRPPLKPIHIHPWPSTCMQVTALPLWKACSSFVDADARSCTKTLPLAMLPRNHQTWVVTAVSGMPAIGKLNQVGVISKATRLRAQTS